MNFLRKVFNSKESVTSISSNQSLQSITHPAAVKIENGPSEEMQKIVSKAKEVPWNKQKEILDLKKAVKNTWGVDCQILKLNEQQAKILAQHAPLDTKFSDIDDQYQIRLSTNSIFIHAHGAFIDLGYTMVFYHGNLYYVNVEPTVQLTTSIYNRTETLSHMAKIMITLNKHIGAQRKTLLICLDGDLSQ